MLADTADQDGYDPEMLERFATDLVAAMGASADHAAQVAESLVGADLAGHNSHGIRRIPSYAQFARGEREDIFTIDTDAKPAVVREGPAYAQVDGGFAFGQVVGRLATAVLMEKVEETGIAVVGIRDATHLGRIGEWTGEVAEAGYLATAFVNGQGGALVAPAGSAQRRYGTNPHSYGIPTADVLPFPIVLDIATSQVAHGKMGEFAATGAPLPSEWTVTEDGGSLSDGAAFEEGQGAILPLGGRTAGYKGFGLAMVAELLASVVGDGLAVSQSDYIRGNAACFVAIDPALFTSREALADRVESLAEFIRTTEYSEHVSPGDAAYGDRAMLPGEPEYLTAKSRRERGVPIPDADVEALCEVADEHGIPGAIPDAFATVRDGA